MAGKIFISYRRDDSRYQARMIYDAIARELPREHIFMDVDTIPPGVDFTRVLEGWVAQCEALLVLMGPNWRTSIDPRSRTLRLDDPKDFVRIEIRGALTRDIPVVPVLLDGAELPDLAELPDEIKPLLDRHAEFVDFRTFDTDVQRLIKKLGIGGRSDQTTAGSSLDIVRKVVVEPNVGDGGDGERDFVVNAQENKARAKQSRSVTSVKPVLLAAALLGAALIGAFATWSIESQTGSKVETAPREGGTGRPSLQGQSGEAENARKAIEGKPADAERKADAVERAPQVPESKIPETSITRQTNIAVTKPSSPLPPNAGAWHFDSMLGSGCAFVQITDSDPRVTTILQFWTSWLSLRMMVLPKGHICKSPQTRGYAELRVGPHTFRSDEITTCNNAGYQYEFFLLPSRARAGEAISDGGLLQKLALYEKGSLTSVTGPKFKQVDITASGIHEAIENASCPGVDMRGYKDR
jgi:hypothetical protein